MLSVADLRARLAALPIDPVPLRRAGILAVLLVVLLVAGKALTPAPRMASERYETPAPAEEVSAARGPAPERSAPRASAPRSAWTGGRVLALLLLAAGGAGALMLRRKGTGRRLPAGSIEVLGTHTLAPGQTLRLVACGDDVLLLGAASEGIRLLRHWPRASFDRATPDEATDSEALLLDALAPASFAALLREATEPLETTEAPAADRENGLGCAETSRDVPLLDRRGQGWSTGEHGAPAGLSPTPSVQGEDGVAVRDQPVSEPTGDAALRLPLVPAEAPHLAARGVLFPAPAPRQFHLADA